MPSKEGVEKSEKRKSLLQTLTANRLMAEAVRFELTCRLLDNLISSYLRASFDEGIKVTLSHHSIEQTRMNQGFSGKNHEFDTLWLDPRI